jgi:DNA gyrase subunit A
VLTVTEGGWAKRTPADQYPVQGRGGQGVLTHRIGSRGELAAACAVSWVEDEVLVAMASGLVLRVAVAEVRMHRRDHPGTRLAGVREDDRVVSVTVLRWSGS